MIVYKAVKKCNTCKGDFCSIVAIGKAKRYYTIGSIHRAPKWLADQGYRLTAFATKRDAISFSWGTPIFRCEATGLTHKLPTRAFRTPLSHGNIMESVCSWPNGTIMCKTIKLLEEVK